MPSVSPFRGSPRKRPCSRPCVADRSVRRLGTIRTTLVVTALPRVGVERPNGSYVARTFNRVGRVISSRSETNVAGVVTRLLNNNSIRYEWRKETLLSLPASLVYRSETFTCLDARRISFLDVSASQGRSSVRAMRPKGTHYK